ncbi:hypothetical protein LTR85_005649 [Meristemomyces frigidus]|nr:hypothetical protein LTR85_005649 [Meristemomyces frigidus]
MASTPSSTRSCRFLKLPPELRNRIYELAFTTEAEEGTNINLLDAAGPTKALLLTCRQIHSEAVGFHKQAYRRYWTTSKFTLSTLNFSPRAELVSALNKLSHVDVEQIKHLLVTIENKRRDAAPSSSASWSCTYDGIGWTLDNQTPYGGSVVRMLLGDADKGRYMEYTFYRDVEEMHNATSVQPAVPVMQQIKVIADCDAS